MQVMVDDVEEIDDEMLVIVLSLVLMQHDADDDDDDFVRVGELDADDIDEID